ncbi:DNA-3-methyladenine glycosylase I [Nisaea sediminum]|uniref:DNA-3-methyladenine glycosylase I n=1 Tax=Nisaea sediminum TaxID=2775867 RepID=UPI0018686F84|nr:DNA-3-methyladenine glycosylase I [Nisaea sediminum]
MPVESFAAIRRRAEEKHGGAAALDKRITEGLRPGDPAALSDDRILAEMAKRVFQAGFSWKVIEAKWPGFEEAFDDFDIAVNVEMSAERLASLMADDRIVRNKPKILAVRDNALLVEQMAALDGSAGRFLAKWDRTDQIGLLEYLKEHGTRLGGATGQYFLRFVGWDGFILSKDVVAALGQAGVIDGPATSKSALAKIQAAFNAWHEESGRPRAEISRTLALSVG